MNTIYSLKSVIMKYDSKIALDIDTLDLYEGRIHVLTGPNGSGKSTLLNVLSFLSRPASGDVVYGGEKVDWKVYSLNRFRKEVTLMHQAPYLFNGSVLDNVGLGLKFRGVGNERYRSMAFECLEQVGLKGFEQRKAKALSGGEKQRVALARALVLEPKVLLLDEPFSNIDAKSTEMLEQLLANLSDRGTTVIVASHDRIFQNKVDCFKINLNHGKVM